MQQAFLISCSLLPTFPPSPLLNAALEKGTINCERLQTDGFVLVLFYGLGVLSLLKHSSKRASVLDILCLSQGFPTSCSTVITAGLTQGVVLPIPGPGFDFFYKDLTHSFQKSHDFEVNFCHLSLCPCLCLLCASVPSSGLPTSQEEKRSGREPQQGRREAGEGQASQSQRCSRERPVLVDPGSR